MTQLSSEVAPGPGGPLSAGELAQRFPNGIDYATYKAGMSDPSDVEAIESLGVRSEIAVPAGSPVRFVLAIVEDWCRDSMDSLPVLANLLEPTAVELRIFPRDDHPELMAAYRKDGAFDAIPVYVVFDAAFTELGRYVERPASITLLRRAEREQLVDRDPELGPADWKPKQFDEPAKSRVKAGIEERRRASRAVATGMIEDALRRTLAIANGARPTSAVHATAPIAFIDDGGGDDCEVPG